MLSYCAIAAIQVLDDPQQGSRVSRVCDVYLMVSLGAKSLVGVGFFDSELGNCA